MKRCFVIQPFDNGIFDKRYVDIFEIAIKNAGFEPYRVDKDLSVRIPIADIEKGISDSEICFAEITTDNPNVWYELGFTVACGKDVVIICCPDERTGKKYPFDIQHRSIIEYKTNSQNDFEALKKNITEKIKAFQQTTPKNKKISKAHIVDTEGLKKNELHLLKIISEYAFNNYTATDSYLRDAMAELNYHDMATILGIKTLTNRGLIKKDSEDNYELTKKGEKWLLDNQHKFEFKIK
jgi:hypothetical protein